MLISGRVIVVGSSNTDLVVPTKQLPKPGETVLGEDLRIYSGGKGANQAVAAARAGGDVFFIGAFGGDQFGMDRKADLEREGINCSGCQIKQKRASGVALISLSSASKNAKAENQISVSPGANAALTARDVKAGLPSDLNKNDIVICSLEISLAAVKAALIEAQKVGALSILNPAPFPAEGLPPEILKRCNFLIPNQHECEKLLSPYKKKTSIKRDAEDENADAMKQFIISHITPKNTPQCIITQGSNGVLWCRISTDPRTYKRNETPYHTLIGLEYPAPNVDPKDTVGAGDCFCGCLAAALSHQPKQLNGAIGFALQAAAISVTREGAQAGMPSLKDIVMKIKKA